jgi:uncharacterized lipoprotein YehR (DUF1307 family)
MKNLLLLLTITLLSGCNQEKEIPVCYKVILCHTNCQYTYNDKGEKVIKTASRRQEYDTICDISSQEMETLYQENSKNIYYGEDSTVTVAIFFDKLTK